MAIKKTKNRIEVPLKDVRIKSGKKGKTAEAKPAQKTEAQSVETAPAEEGMPTPPEAQKQEQTTDAAAPTPPPAPSQPAPEVRKSRWLQEDGKHPAPHIMTQAEVGNYIAAHSDTMGAPNEWIIENNKIVSAKVLFGYDYGGVVQLAIELARTIRQPLGIGYNNSHNVGFIIEGLMRLFGCGHCSPSDACADLTGTPVRVAYRLKNGANINDCVFLGHFMDDKWIHLKELMIIGNHVFKPWFIGE